MRSTTTLLAVLVIGIVLGAGFAMIPASVDVARGDADGWLSIPEGLIREARAELDEGDFEFFPNRRSIWVVNRSNGRMTNYHFRDDEVGSVDRSRVVTIDLNAFPREDTEILISDRNLNNILWVCNRRTGDLQMWYPARDGNLRAERPVATSPDLAIRAIPEKQ